ncbi:hypothetical protein ACEQ8H_004806 [Pleosporales sp. CAS-2024a]
MGKYRYMPSSNVFGSTTKTEKQQQQPWSRRRKLILAGVATVLILALALGLGLGLTLGNSGNDDNDSGDGGDGGGGPTLSPLPSPNSTLPWTPRVNDTWQIVLSAALVVSDTVTPDVSVFDIDLFDTPADTIERLHKLGKKVICYFSAGSFENWRPDAKDFAPEDLGHNLNGWPGEKWLKLSSPNVQSIMKKRIEMAQGRGCDGIDPDNIDGYENNNGLGLTTNDSIHYMQYLSSVARPLNLTLGLKNGGKIISAVLPLVDFSVNEQCVQYSECDSFHAFIDAGKPVFHIEYPDGNGNMAQNTDLHGFNQDTQNKFCDAKGSSGFSTVLKKMNLDGWVQYCHGQVQETGVNSTTSGQN